MRSLRRRIAAGAALLACAAPFGVAQAQDATRDKDNIAVATTEQDGARAFDFSYSVEYQRGGVVDHKNVANAAARCTDCRATAIAFQIVLVSGSPTQLVAAQPGGRDQRPVHETASSTRERASSSAPSPTTRASRTMVSTRCTTCAAISPPSRVRISMPPRSPRRSRSRSPACCRC